MDGEVGRANDGSLRLRHTDNGRGGNRREWRIGDDRRRCLDRRPILTAQRPEGGPTDRGADQRDQREHEAKVDDSHGLADSFR